MHDYNKQSQNNNSATTAVYVKTINRSGFIIWLFLTWNPVSRVYLVNQFHWTRDNTAAVPYNYYYRGKQGRMSFPNNGFIVTEGLYIVPSLVTI